MRVVAMMSFYDEEPEMLASSVRDLAVLGVDTIVACDGAYAQFPDGSRESPDVSVETLRLACCEHDLGLLLYQPSDVWHGNEIEKRQTMLDLAWAISEEGDWFVVWDCDYGLVESPGASVVRDTLSRCEQDFVTITFTESSQDDGWHPMQMFIRAQEVVMCGNHHTYALPDGRRSQILRRPVQNMAEALHMDLVRVHHRVHERDLERRQKQTKYYEVRDSLGLET